MVLLHQFQSELNIGQPCVERTATVRSDEAFAIACTLDPWNNAPLPQKLR
jgi:hypothetical protein